MERENNKREREEEEEEIKTKDTDKEPSSAENTSKRQHLVGRHKHNNKVDIISRDDDEENKDHECSALGVFDFPWRKESMINAISEEWCFEDSFFSPNNNTNCTSHAVESEFPNQCLSESEKRFVESIDFPPDKFEETVWSSEKEGVDCTLLHDINRNLMLNGIK